MATENSVAPLVDRTDEPTIGRLVSDASRDISTLVSKEIQLAKTELKVSMRFGAAGVVFFVAAAFIAVLAIIMLSVAFAYLIHWNGHGLALHWAFLIVAGAYLLIAGLLAFIGIKKFKKVGPPEKAIAEGKQIPAALKGHA
ncbi:phage holin family protein [Nocardioides sp. GXZ039]|uniref:phage holin family protein n=1 Tax=Nocardioides sp. GXZ039 TaxID=3136018 RepID=UPI0030F46DC2